MLIAAVHRPVLILQLFPGRANLEARPRDRVQEEGRIPRRKSVETNYYAHTRLDY